MNAGCRLGFHKMKFVKTIEVPEHGYYKVYEVKKCSRCGKLETRLKDLVPFDIFEFGKTN